MCEELISSSWEKNHMSNFSYTISIGQLGEQLTLNQWVLGSSPRWRTKKVPVERPGFFAAPSPAGRLRRSRKRSASARGDRSLKTLRRSVFFTRPLMTHQKSPGRETGIFCCAIPCGGGLARRAARSCSPRGDRSLKTLRRSVFFTRPLMAHRVSRGRGSGGGGTKGLAACAGTDRSKDRDLLLRHPL